MLALCCTWGSLVPVARSLRTHLSAWRQISGCRCQQAACRCRAPGSRHSQRASGRAGTGCCGRSAAGRRKEVAAMPVAARTSPVTAAASLCSSKISSSTGSRAAASLQGAGEAGAQGSASRGSSLLVLAGSTLSWPPEPQHIPPVPLLFCSGGTRPS